MRVARDLTVTAADGTRLILDHPLPYPPGDGRRAGVGVVVWIRTPYGRKGIASIAKRFAKPCAALMAPAGAMTRSALRRRTRPTCSPGCGADRRRRVRHR